MSDSTQKKPWWYPSVFGPSRCADLREFYPDGTNGLSDEALNDRYNNGRKYNIGWDHTGDAYEDYEPLADAFLESERDNAALRQRVKELEEYARKMDESAESISQFIGEVCHSSWCAGWSMGQVPNQPSTEKLLEQRISDCRRIVERMLKISSKNVFEPPAKDARHD